MGGGHSRLVLIQLEERPGLVGMHSGSPTPAHLPFNELFTVNMMKTYKQQRLPNSRMLVPTGVAVLLAGLVSACSPGDERDPVSNTSLNTPNTKALSNTRTPGNGTAKETPVAGRWYTREQVERGNVVFQANCAGCHNPDASGTADWKQTDANGKYPPPPLNGTAHTWHHPMSILHRTVAMGGQRLGGSMPGFGENLTAAQITDVLAWVQAQWPDEIYAAWKQRNDQATQTRP